MVLRFKHMQLLGSNGCFFVMIVCLLDLDNCITQSDIRFTNCVVEFRGWT